MFQRILNHLKYWYATKIKRINYSIVFTLKEVIYTLPPVKIGDISLARGMKNVYFTEEELKKQGKNATGNTIRFLALGCTIKACNKALAKEIIINGLKANAYSTINIEKNDTSCYCTIQPYSA